MFWNDWQYPARWENSRQETFKVQESRNFALEKGTRHAVWVFLKLFLNVISHGLVRAWRKIEKKNIV